jgi:FkbM family methyltransferase
VRHRRDIGGFRLMIDECLLAYARMPDHPMKGRILRRLLKFRRGRPFRARLAFGTFDLDLDDFLQRAMFYSGAFEPKTIALLRSLLKPGDCFIDVGANIGQFAVAAGSVLRDNGIVVAIEPNPEICANLLRNRALNGLQSTIVVVPAAVAETHRMATFGIPYETNRGSSREVPAEFPDKVHVLTSTLREICAALGIDTVDVMKIDVEGSELTVLRSLFDDNTSPRPNHIICEYMSDQFDYSDARGDLISCLTKEGYVIRTVDGIPYSPITPLTEYNIWASRNAQAQSNSR